MYGESLRGFRYYGDKLIRHSSNKRREPTGRWAVESQKQSRCLQLLIALGVFTTVGYAAINLLSWQFKFDSSTADRPIIAVLSLFAFVFGVYLVAIWASKRCLQNAKLVWLIVGFALLFRVTMLLSHPIQEVDIYRYLWDGEVSAQGVSPFQFAPSQVLSAPGGDTGNHELDKLVALRDANPEVAEVLRRVHYGELPTIYPPTSQLVFHAVAASTPDDATVISRVWIMKAWLVGFDLGVLFLLIKLLSLCRLPVGLSVIYAWCPLVMKEAANSGHLDTIAVFLTTLAIYLFVRVLGFVPKPAVLAIATVLDGAKPGLSPKRLGGNRTSGQSLDGFDVGSTERQIDPFKLLAGMLLVALTLAAAVGAKLYPVVLAPLILLVFARRFGWRSALIPAAAFVLTAFFLLAPLIPSRSSVESVELPSAQGSSSLSKTATDELANDTSHLPEPPLPAVLPPAASPTAVLPSTVPPSTMPPPDVPVVVTGTEATDPSLGVTTFLKYWEMNDFIFMIVVENLKLNSGDSNVWFSIVPESFRQPLVNLVAQKFSIPAGEAPFLITRAITGLVFVILALRLAWRAGSQLDEHQHNNARVFCEAAFLTLAWFWLLLPTQNPWYWMWALPLLPFMRNRAWLAVSGLILVYYLRFWLDYHFSETQVLGTTYMGTAFFDFVVTWIEYAPWFVWLAAERLIIANRSRV